MDDGWFIEIDESKLNEANKIAKRRLQQQAIRSGILERAKEHADVIIGALFAPLASNPRLKYEIEVEFGPQFQRRNVRKR